jgi:hypothetical protein
MNYIVAAAHTKAKVKSAKFTAKTCDILVQYERAQYLSLPSGLSSCLT